MMHFSSTFEASAHCIPSPDGTLIATLLPSTITFRSVKTLGLVRFVKLPTDVAGGVTTFVWSPSSRRVLLSVRDQIHVFAAIEGDYHAVVREPGLSVGKPTFIDFGASDEELCVFSAHGIKLSLFHLHKSKAVEVANPKFFSLLSAQRGLSLRPSTHHIALLTRSQGKDSISIHSPETREVQRSWNPDTIDASGIAWTPDGRWLAVWESAAHGHRLLLYTPDGNVFRDWRGPDAPDKALEDLGAGIRCLSFSPDGDRAIATDFGRTLNVLSMHSAKETRLHHPLSIEPRDTLQVWQEHGPGTEFVKIVQHIAPNRSSASIQDSKSGCDFAAFDASSTLLATKLEEAPSTAFIWDVPASELRAVLLFRGKISRLTWHPHRPEILLITCEGEDAHKGVVFIWDPLSHGPCPVHFASKLHQGGTLSGRAFCAWLNYEGEAAALFFSDHERGILSLVAEIDTDELPWHFVETDDMHEQHAQDKSLQSATKREEYGAINDTSLDELEDTFHFKKAGLA